MSCRHYRWAVVFLIISCASFFDRRNDFQKGLTSYQQSHYDKAIEHFLRYAQSHPRSETTFYYLHDCYRQLNQHEKSIQALEALIKMGTEDAQVYLALFKYYEKAALYRELHQLITNASDDTRLVLNRTFPLTRKRYAELLSGVSSDARSSADPIVFAVSKGYMPMFLNGKFYENDIITNGNLIIILDNLVEPLYPARFFTTKHIANNSYLYLPYMRLVHLGILTFDEELSPEKPAFLDVAAQAIAILKDRGIVD